jgi:hypothetical protein
MTRLSLATASTDQSRCNSLNVATVRGGSRNARNPLLTFFAQVLVGREEEAHGQFARRFVIDSARQAGKQLHSASTGE